MAKDKFKEFWKGEFNKAKYEVKETVEGFFIITDGGTKAVVDKGFTTREKAEQYIKDNLE